MNHSIHPMTPEDGPAVIEIFNHYIRHSFAAYPEREFTTPQFDILWKSIGDHPSATVRDERGAVIGFGLLRPHHALPTFSETAEITYFLDPDHTGNGLGKLLLDHLEAKARDKGIRQLLASVSSLNPGSIRFHERNGFAEAGRFRNVGRKNGRHFDTVWMQKPL